MSPRPTSSAAVGLHAVLAVPSRRRLLGMLRSAPGARDVHDLAAAVDLHVSTVRFHLEVLRRAGLVVRHTSPPEGLGRPRTAYSAVGREDPAVAVGYQQLAALLAAGLADTAEERTVRAEELGARLAPRLMPRGSEAPADLDGATEDVRALFADLGFDPDVDERGRDRRITLRGCPFRDVARQHPEVVCAAHGGLLRGALEHVHATAQGRLQPFVAPDVCVATLVPQP